MFEIGFLLLCNASRTPYVFNKPEPPGAQYHPQYNPHSNISGHLTPSLFFKSSTVFL